MKIALLGFGRMGREIETLALQRGDTVVVRATSSAPLESADPLVGVDVAIDFSRADAVMRHVELCARAQRPVVIGTTGLSEQLISIQKAVLELGIGCVYGANFSLGVHAFLQIVRRAGEVFNHLPSYDVALSEMHHANKVDAPSGTALAIGAIVSETVARKERVVPFVAGRTHTASELVIASQRIGAVPGTHQVLFDSAVDSIELTHTARSRAGFALGALEAAHWVAQRSGFFTVEQFVNDMLTRSE